jgi:hypothetical protein
MSTSRDLTGLTGAGPVPPDRTVGAPPPRRRSPRPGKSSGEPRDATSPVGPAVSQAEEPRQPHPRTTPPHRQASSRSGPAVPAVKPPSTVRISVNIPLDCRQWLSKQAQDQQRFVSEILMEAVDRYGEDVSPPSGRAKRVAVPNGTICNIVLPADDRQRIDDLVAQKGSTRSALVTEVLRIATELRS